MMPDKLLDLHKIFLTDFDSNAAAITARYGENWKVICGHCSNTIAGSIKDAGEPVSVLWTHDGASWFGKFEEVA